MTALATLLAELLNDPDVRAALDARLRAAVRAELAAARAHDPLLTVAEAAQIDGRSLAAMRRAVSRGSIPAVRIGRSVRIRRSTLVGISQGRAAR